MIDGGREVDVIKTITKEGFARLGQSSRHRIQIRGVFVSTRFLLITTSTSGQVGSEETVHFIQRSLRVQPGPLQIRFISVLYHFRDCKKLAVALHSNRPRQMAGHSGIPQQLIGNSMMCLGLVRVVGHQFHVGRPLQRWVPSK